MAQVANNAFRPQRHALAQLGAVSLGTKTSFSQISSEGIGVRGTETNRPRESGPGLPTTTTSSSGTLTSRQPAPTLSSLALSPTGLQPGGIRPAGTVATTTTSGGSKTSGAAIVNYGGGGGGGSSAGSGGAWSDMPPTDEGALAELATPATMPANGKKTNWLLIAGVAAGAYYLLTRKG